MITYKNSSSSNYVKGRRITSVKRIDSTLISNNQDEYKFPVTLELVCDQRKFEIIDNKKQYILPDRITENYDSIMSSHNHSDVYNSLNIRLDDFKYDDNTMWLY